MSFPIFGKSYFLKILIKLSTIDRENSKIESVKSQDLGEVESESDEDPNVILF